jgi:sugar phosphate isomerase/epimerase
MAVSDVGVFLNTTGITDPERACAAVRELGFRSIQFGWLPDRFYAPEGTRQLARMLQNDGLTAVALCIVHDGESYADIDAVRRTVGFIPAETVAARVHYSQRCVDAAVALDIPLVTTHIGILPADPHDPVYQRVQSAVHQLAVYAHGCGVQLAIETGQETAEQLLELIRRLEVPVGINFDGANFIAYGTQDPLDALKRLYAHTVGVHIKDRMPPPAPGLLGPSWPLGRGQARVDETLNYLRVAGYNGPIILETYTDADHLDVLTEARDYVVGRLGAPTNLE